MSRLTLGSRHAQQTAAAGIERDRHGIHSPPLRHAASTFEAILEKLEDAGGDCDFSDEESFQGGIDTGNFFNDLSGGQALNFRSKRTNSDVLASSVTPPGVSPVHDDHTSYAGDSGNGQVCDAPDVNRSLVTACETVLESMLRSWSFDSNDLQAQRWQLHIQIAGSIRATVAIEHSMSGEWSLSVGGDEDNGSSYDSAASDEAETTEDLIAISGGSVEQFCVELTARLRVSQPDMRFTAWAR